MAVIPSKLTRRVYTFSVPDGEGTAEKTIEKYTIVGGPDPSVMTDEFAQREGEKLFGPGAVLTHVQDFARSVDVTVKE